MGRGFGRGAKSVAIVTHAEVKRQKKVPRGLKFGRKKKRRMYKQQGEDGGQVNPIEEVGPGAVNPKSLKDKRAAIAEAKKSRKNTAEQVAGLRIASSVAGRRKGLASLRKELLKSTKELNRQNHIKRMKKAQQDIPRQAKKSQLRRAAHAKKVHGVELEPADE